MKEILTPPKGAAMNSFVPIFAVVFGIFFLIVLYEGIVAFRKNTKEADFLVAGRQMGAWVGGASIAATQMSAGTFVGTLGIHYLTGSSFLAPTIGIWTAFLIAGFIIAPRLRRYIDQRGAMTFPDYIADRYGPSARLVITILIIGAYIVFLSAQYQAGGVIFGQVFGINFGWGAAGLMAFIVLYTVIGGMTAVMRTDFLQQIVMSAAALIGIPFVIHSAGGITTLGSSLTSAAPKFTGWHYGPIDILGFTMGFGFAALTAPVLLMRYYAMRDEKTCARGSVVAVFFTMITFGSVAIIGMGMRVIYPDLSNPDTASTVFATNVLPAFVGALLLTAVLAAVLSTVDSVLLVVGPAVSHDIYATFLQKNSTQRSRMRVNRAATIVLGVVPLFLTLAQLDVVQFIVLAYAALIGSTVFAPLIFGLFWTRANRVAALSSMIGGFGICMVWYIIGKPWFDPVVPGVIVNTLVMVVVASSTKRPERKFLEPFFRFDENALESR